MVYICKHYLYFIYASHNDDFHSVLVHTIDQMAQQLQQMEAGQRKSEMDRLQKENWLLYVSTKERMEFNGRKEATSAAQQAQQEQAQGGVQQ